VTRHILCRLNEIADGAARGFLIGEGAARLDVVIVRREGAVRAYLNSCPHQLMPLETFPNKFLNEDGTQFICSTHGARFRVDDGYCVSGPCEGKSLRSIACAVVDGAVVIESD
jgi:nitrite reductase/ring-hydroxylating ferredoxin subunit